MAAFFSVFLVVVVVREAGDFAAVLRGDLAAAVRAGLVAVVFLAVVLGLVVLLRGDAFAFAVTVRLEAVDLRAFTVVVFFFMEPPIVRFALELFFAVELLAVVFFLAGLLAAVAFFAVGFFAREELVLLLAVFFFAGDDFERELDEDFFEPPLLFDFKPVEREPVDFFLVGISYFLRMLC